LTVGDHYHLNWGFSEPGTYTVEFQASGVRSSDQVEIMSEVTTYTFEVVAPEPVDLKIGRGEDSSLLLMWNTETGVQYQIQSKASGSDVWQDLGAVVDGDGTEAEFSFEPEQSSTGSWFRIKRIWP